MLKDTQPTAVVRVARWIEKNISVVDIISKPAVYVASADFEWIVPLRGRELD